MKRKGKGTFAEKEIIIDTICIRTIKWFDNRSVHVASTFCSAYPLRKVKRWHRNSKVSIEVECPQLVKTYNKFMGLARCFNIIPLNPC